LNTLAPVCRPEDAYVGDLIGLYGAIDAGITSILDWLHIQDSPDHTDAVLKALQDSRLRTDRMNVMPINDPIGAVVLGRDTSNVDSVFIAGRPMKRNGQLLYVDWNAVKKMVSESQEYVIQKAHLKTPTI
jgi:cytosine/adenosine deaminase-related metal-dependent hydrolase